MASFCPAGTGGNEMARSVLDDDLITVKAAQSRVRRAVKQALAVERRVKPHAFTDEALIVHDKDIRHGGYQLGQAELRATHVVLTQDEFAVRLDAARTEQRAEFDRLYPHIFTEAGLDAHDGEVRRVHGEKLRAAFVAELVEKCTEAEAVGSKKAVEAIRLLLSKAFPKGIFFDKPHFVPGVARLATVLFEETKSNPGTPEAEFAINFAHSVFSAM